MEFQKPHTKSHALSFPSLSTRPLTPHTAVTLRCESHVQADYRVLWEHREGTTAGLAVRTGLRRLCMPRGGSCATRGK